MMRLRRLAAIMLLLMLAGCARAPKPAPPPDSPPPAGRAPAPTGVAARSLFPAATTQFEFRVFEGNADETVTEGLAVRDGRIDGFYDGVHYLTWHLNEEGVWREDPGGSKVALRYLPPVLEETQWQHRAGEHDVWFRLSYAPHRCMGRGDACWQLEVVRLSQRTIFEFLEGKGPVQVLHHDHGSGEWFVKYQMVEEPPNAGLLDAMLSSAMPPAAPLEGATEAAFAAEVDRLMSAGPEKLVKMALDLDGDGRPEIVRAVAGGWMKGPAYIETHDGRIADYLIPMAADVHRVTAVTVPGYPHHFFAHERAKEKRPKLLSIIHLLPTERLGYLMGWTDEGHSQWVEADLWRFSEDGQTLTIERELRDPAAHTQVVEYQLVLSEPLKVVRRTAISYRSTGSTLIYPRTHQGVLHAAFATKWAGLSDEVARYFASPEAAEVMVKEERLKQPYHFAYGGNVRFGAVGAVQNCSIALQEAALKPTGENTYLATWSQYGECYAVWGKVTFGTDAEGRPVIRTLTIEGSHEGSYL